MRRVARNAAFRTDRCVFKYKRPAYIGVAFGAYCVLISGRFQIVRIECAVGIVAVAALHQSLIHLVVEGHAKCRFRIGVALEAEIRLRSLEQLFLLLARVNTVTAGATNVRFRVR